MAKANNKGAGAEKLKELSKLIADRFREPETLKAITNIIIDRFTEEEAKLTKAHFNRRRANTKMLLRNYRSLKEHSESAIYEAAQAERDFELAEILDMMGAGKRGGIKVESIRESAARTALIIEHVDRMLEAYRISCERSRKPEDMRRYRVIHGLYISAVPETAEDIAENECIDRSTVYRDIDAAVERLSAMLFGIDGLHILKR